MKITLVRHGQTENNYLHILNGRDNEMLNDTGRRQCQKLRERLMGISFDFCYMSPLVRTVETAFILIGDRTQTFPDDRLIERDLGELTGKDRSCYDVKKFWDYDLNYSMYGVEKILDVFDRCRDFLNYVIQKHPVEHILVVSHGAPIRALYHLLLHHSLHGNLLKEEIPNCYVCEIEVKEGTHFE